MTGSKAARIALAALVCTSSGGALAQQGYGGPQGDPRYDNRGDPRYDDRRGDDDRRDRGPGGRPSASFYVKDNFGGRSIVLDHGVRDLHEVDMNDNISSIDIRNGTWLVCVDADFQGRCVTLDRSVRHLDKIGMDDKISSVRPIRGRDDRN